MLLAVCINSCSWTRPPCLDTECLRQQDVMNAWHSQEGQDRHIAAILKGKRGGYFIDLAANEPVQISNTRALERDYGWKGLCIEPNSRYWQALSQTRSCSLVTNPVSNVEEPMLMTERGTFSSSYPSTSRSGGHPRAEHTALRRAGLMKVQTRRLDKLLTEHRTPATIDYLSLDVEGHEYEALLSFPLIRTDCCCRNGPSLNSPISSRRVASDMFATMDRMAMRCGSSMGGIRAATVAAWRRRRRPRRRRSRWCRHPAGSSSCRTARASMRLGRASARGSPHDMPRG